MGGQQGKDAAANGSIKRKAGDKKTTQNLKKDGPHPDDSDSSDSTNNNKQWLSDVDLAPCVDGDDDENLFVALYDFKSGASNQLDLVKGEKVILLEHNESKEWSRVEKKNSPVSISGWIPTNYIASISSYGKFSWFHGPLSRNAAEYLLSSGITGSFLVRDSESCPGQMTLSVRYEEKYFHYKIQRDVDMVFVAEQQRFASLDQLVSFYSKEAGLVTALQFAIQRVNKPPIFALSPDMEKWEVDRSEIEMKQQLGSGQYGDVYEAMWKRHNLQVAVKTLRAESTALEDFLKEVTIMKEMKHSNLVQLLGICTWQPPYYIITEYMSEGNLLDYLRGSSPEELRPVTLFYMATQIASAMGYLEEKNFIHRDLAARNCLVGEHHLVKVADFGLARLVHDDTYTAQTACKFPIKWTAPEGLMYGTFSTKSDVWAFGVLLWELATYGETPYPSIDLQDVYQFVEKGRRMDCPPECPPFVYDLMKQCWKWDPAERPTFHQIHDILNTFQKSDINEEPELKLGGSERKPAVVNTDAVVSGSNHKKSPSITPPLCPVSKPTDFHPESRPPAAESSSSRKPPMPPKKDFVREHPATRQDGMGTDSRNDMDKIISNHVLGQQHSVDDSKTKFHKTQVTESKLLPPKPTVNLAVLGGIAAGLRRAAEKDAPKPSLNEQQLNEVRSSLKKLSNPLPTKTSWMKPSDAILAKYNTMPHSTSGINMGASEIPSQGTPVVKKKAYSASEACEAKLDINPENSESGKLEQITKPVTLNLAESRLESSRTVPKHNSGDASNSSYSAGPQRTLQGNKQSVNKPKPPITGPKPSKPNPQTTITPL